MQLGLDLTWERARFERDPGSGWVNILSCCLITFQTELLFWGPFWPLSKWVTFSRAGKSLTEIYSSSPKPTWHAQVSRSQILAHYVYGKTYGLINSNSKCQVWDTRTSKNYICIARFGSMSSLGESSNLTTLELLLTNFEMNNVCF